MTKQVIVMRKDLNMRKGKMVAQGAHASLEAVLSVRNLWDSENGYMGTGSFGEEYGPVLDKWLDGLATKICVGVETEADLKLAYHQAVDAGLPCSIICDAGLTEFKEPTFTAVAIGPAEAEEIDKITAHLKLL